jgi:hypothetical protein
MGNRSSSVQPSGPPPLLSAAVVGDVAKFGESWTGENSIDVRDAQENNVLHALFSCRVCVENNANSKCSEILNRIHNSLPSSRWKEAYRARNAIGCTPLWILVAYGNVALLKEAKQKFADDNDDDAMDDFLELLRQPNKQGDSPLLATCSQGNTDMVCYLKEELLSPDQFNAAISESNHNGTTPLQIIVGNNHASLLEFVLRERGTALHSQFLEYNKAGLSLFHICSERNAHEILKPCKFGSMSSKKLLTPAAKTPPKARNLQLQLRCWTNWMGNRERPTGWEWFGDVTQSEHCWQTKVLILPAILKW